MKIKKGDYIISRVDVLTRMSTLKLIKNKMYEVVYADEELFAIVNDLNIKQYFSIEKHFKDNFNMAKTHLKSYKVVSKDSYNEVWAKGFSSIEKPQRLINEGYFHKYMYEKDKNKELIVVEETNTQKNG